MTDPRGSDDFAPVTARLPATGDDEVTRRRARAERAAAVSFLVAMGAAIGLTVVYWEGGQPQADGTDLRGRCRDFGEAQLPGGRWRSPPTR